jgi:hypothetical protein
MNTITLNKQCNAYPASQLLPSLVGCPIEKRTGKEMHLNNFKTDKERFWMIVQFFKADKSIADFASIHEPGDISIKLKDEFSSFVIILDTDEGERQVSFDMEFLN